MTLPNQDPDEDDTLETDPAPKPDARITNLSQDWREAMREDLDDDAFTKKNDKDFDLRPDQSNCPADTTVECTDELDDDKPHVTGAPKGPRGFGC
jgi:hypothetical protein